MDSIPYAQNDRCPRDEEQTRLCLGEGLHLGTSAGKVLSMGRFFSVSLGFIVVYWVL